MSLPAIIVMLASIAALWGVATISLIYSMRQENRKLALIQAQGDFEPFSPAAQQDIVDWLSRNPNGEHMQEMRDLLSLQRQAMKDNPDKYYSW